MSSIDLIKAIADLEIENNRLRLENGHSVDIHLLYKRLEKLIKENETLKSKLKNELKHNDDANNIPNNDSFIFEAYEVNSDIQKSMESKEIRSCFMNPIVTWKYQNNDNNYQEHRPSSGIDCIADFSFPTGAFIDVVPLSCSFLLTGPQYDRYHISQFLDANGEINCHACFITIRVIDSWPDDPNIVKYIVNMAKRKRAGKRIKSFLENVIRLKKHQEFLSDTFSSGGTSICAKDNIDTSKSIFRYFRRTPKKNEITNNRFQLFKSSTKSTDSIIIDSKTTTSTSDNNDRNDSITSTSNPLKDDINHIKTEPSENVKRIALALIRARQLGVPIDSPAITQSMQILSNSNALYLLSTSEACHIYYDDDNSTCKTPPPKPPKINFTNSNTKNNDDDINVITKNKLFIRDKCFCIITSNTNHTAIFHAIQAIVDTERNTSDSTERNKFLSYIYSGIVNNVKNNFTGIDSYSNFYRRLATSPDNNDFVMAILLSIIDSRVIIKIMNLLLTEKSIIVIGTNPGVVSIITLGISTLIQPFKWTGALLPIVPRNITELFGAPIPFILGTIATTLNFDDINTNTAVLSIYDPELDRKPCSFTTTKKEIYRQNKCTEAFFTRLPELHSTMPICVHLENQLRSSRRLLMNSKVGSTSANVHLFDLCFMKNGMTSSETTAVRNAVDAIRKHNFKFMGRLATEPGEWKKFARNETEFSTISFMRPIKDKVDFQESLINTQFFGEFFSQIRHQYISNHRYRLFIFDFVSFKYFYRKINKYSRLEGNGLESFNTRKGTIRHDALLLLTSKANGDQNLI